MWGWIKRNLLSGLILLAIGTCGEYLREISNKIEPIPLIQKDLQDFKDQVNAKFAGQRELLTKIIQHGEQRDNQIDTLNLKYEILQLTKRNK